MPFDRPMNMSVWEFAKDVPAEFRKPFEIGKRKLTAIDPMYLFMKATELWGAIGTGWGFEILEDKFVNNGTAEHQLHVMRVKLWYKGGAVESEGVHNVVMDATYGVGCTRVFTRFQDGEIRVDDEFNKKTLTDALTNALSRLGFGADVRMGEFDGGKYLNGETDEDAELRKAWDEYVVGRRAEKDYEPDVTDEKIVQSAIEFLQANSRRVTPETIRAMMR